VKSGQLTETRPKSNTRNAEYKANSQNKGGGEGGREGKGRG
jgi:hypothetical protein